MALLKYYKLKEKLPKPDGPLSQSIPSSSILAANEEVSKVGRECSGDDAQAACGKRGAYTKFSTKSRAEIAKYAAEHGVTATVRHFCTNGKYPNLKESSVRTWRNAYTAELEQKRKMRDDNMDVKELPEKKRGRPLALGDELDAQVKQYVLHLRDKGAVVNTAIVQACAEGIVKNYDKRLLVSNGGHIMLTRDWAKSLLCRLGFVKRRGSTAAKITVTNFEELKEQYLLDVKAVVQIEEIPHEMIVNWDQTGIKYVPVDTWTMEKEGAKRVQVIGADDKRQITAVFAGTITGEFLPPQLIYQGTTTRCLPYIKFPAEWHVTFSANHWSNEATMVQYIKHILLPYLANKRCCLQLEPDYPALVIFDNFKAQITEGVLQLLEDNNIRIAMVPPNCTDRLQPMDVSVNKAVKNFLRQQFQRWYADQVCEQLARNKNSELVDLKLSIVKPLGASWMIKAYDYIKSQPDIVINGFKGSGLFDSIK